MKAPSAGASRLLVGRGLARRPRLWMKGLFPAGRVMLVSQPAVWRLHGAGVRGALRRAGLRVHCHLLSRGEKAKTWPAVAGLMRAMLRRGMGRDAAIAALGGGCVSDAAGFAAAIYLRGIPWVSLPTTLLGQVDGGIGGKTGINLPAGKNLAGAFHPPLLVVCDTEFLDTLPRRERNCGLAEAAKFALVLDAGLWSFMRRNWPGLLRGDPAATESLVRRAAAGKLALTARDPRETLGPRELLNFGHTVGHALEAAAGLGPLRHGEAVVNGMRAALRLSRAHAGLPAATAAGLDGLLSLIPLPRLRLREQAVLAALDKDKKVRRGRNRFVLLKGLGRPVVKTLPRRGIREAVRFILGELR